MKTYLANAPVETMAGRVRQVQAFFRERGQGQRLRCASPFRSPWLPEGYAQRSWAAVQTRGRDRRSGTVAVTSYSASWSRLERSGRRSTATKLTAEQITM